MTDQGYVYATAALMAGLLAWQVATKRFDPFAPVWLFLVGYAHLYVIQAVTLREWALGIRGIEVVTAANFRAFWALAWFLALYYVGPGKFLAGRLPGPPRAWSFPAVVAFCPFLIAWGGYCAWAVFRQGQGEDPSSVSAEESLFRSFPFVLMVAGVLLIVSGRRASAPNRLAVGAGALLAATYVMVWMFNGKRSHALIGVLSAVCAYYVTRQKRPSWPVLLTTAFLGAMVVAVAIGWRNTRSYDRSAAGFVQFLGDFEVAKILVSLNIEDEDGGEVDTSKVKSYETLEYGGFLLMLDTVPEKAEHDYGACYLRCFSTFIPRIVWPDKPLYGREQWIKAWQAGSELKRDDEFTGPAIGLHGATQLNGGSAATLIVFAVIATLTRTAYEFFRRHESAPWVQAWWALTYFNAWFMVVADDPSTWFYYNYGFSCLPILAVLWAVNKLGGAAAGSPVALAAA